MKTLNVLFSLLGLLEISGHVRAVGTETSHWFRRKLPKAEQPSEKFDLNNKIKNVVVLVMENRSFNQILGHLKEKHPDIDSTWVRPGQNQTTYNVIGQNKVYVGTQASTILQDPPHNFVPVNEQLFNKDFPLIDEKPCMCGFLKSASRYWKTTDPIILQQIMNVFTPKQLPVIYSMAKQGAVFNRWYASVPGPTYPNRLFIFSATSAGLLMNDNKKSFHGFPQKSIFQSLHEAGITWKNYHHGFPNSLYFKWARHHLGHLHFMKRFYSDAKEGKLPQFSLIDPRIMDLPFLGVANDDHPPHDISRGQRLIKRVYEALRSSPQWNSTLFLLTYDEHGGYYDPIPPPMYAPNPDTMISTDPVFHFDRLGLRVPTIAISPWIDPQIVQRPINGPHTTSEYDHTSIAATLKRIFNLPSFLTRRDAWAGTFEHLWSNRTTPRTDHPMKLSEPIEDMI